MAVLASQTVGVMGSGDECHEFLARGLGQLLARHEVNLLTGGGGVMEAVSRAFIEARRGTGICIGIIPCNEADPCAPKPGYPNRFVELPIYTHLPYSGDRGKERLSRNHINVLSCDAIVALPVEHGQRRRYPWPFSTASRSSSSRPMKHVSATSHPMRPAR
jgi:uncharacterized protein (TIGR00725 family)